MKLSDYFEEVEALPGTIYYQVEFQPTGKFLDYGVKPGFLRIGFIDIESEKIYIDNFCNNRPYILTRKMVKNKVYLYRKKY